jgi:tRNA (guanine37-N1)-methyltransferase
MVVIEAITRLLPGVLGSEDSLIVESYTADSGDASIHSRHVVEYPQYTRPEMFQPFSEVTWSVPKVLLSGDRKEICKWQKEHSVSVKTKEYAS